MGEKGMKKTAVIILSIALIAGVALAATGCSSSSKPTGIILSTTTSTQDSGLLTYLLPKFEKQYNHTVKTIAVGSGQAIKMGEQGDADVVLAHDQAAEMKSVAQGFTLQYVKVMYNDFIILGPSADPAGIKGDKSAVDAFKKIAAAGDAGKAVFVSRADGSGTNVAELNLWKKAGVDPNNKSWYVKTGQGMGQTLAVSDEKQAYTLADRATYVSRTGNKLVILSEGDPSLFNQYGVEVVNPAKHPNIKLNVKGAGDFVQFLTSKEGQDMIAAYKLKNVQLFHPNAAGETRGMGSYKEQ